MVARTGADPCMRLADPTSRGRIERPGCVGSNPLPSWKRQALHATPDKWSTHIYRSMWGIGKDGDPNQHAYADWVHYPVDNTSIGRIPAAPFGRNSAS